MTAAVAALVLALWLLGGHLRDDRLGRAVRFWMGPGAALALVSDGAAVTGVAAVGFALLVAVLFACARRGSAGLPADVRELLYLAEREARTRYARELQSTASGPISLPSEPERAVHG
jgi:hypothetical protein